MESSWIPILGRKILQSKGKGRVKNFIFLDFEMNKNQIRAIVKEGKKGQRDYKMTFNDPH